MDTTKKTYLRNIKSRISEQILNECQIYVDLKVLRPHLMGDGINKLSDIYRYAKTASQNGGYISTEYDSRGKITARLFTKRGHLNLITLNDDVVLSSIRSRYDDGHIVVLDFKNFEPTIMKNIFHNRKFGTLHDWTSELLDINRSDIKAYNMGLLYSHNFSNHSRTVAQNLLRLHNCTHKQIGEYILQMQRLRGLVDRYSEQFVPTFNECGYVINTYGRKIYSKKHENIFNNIIQSIGSEILIESIIKLNDFLREKPSYLLFHRFDALYFDMPNNSYQDLKKIIQIMESIEPNLKVGVQIGKNLKTLKDLDSV